MPTKTQSPARLALSLCLSAALTGCGTVNAVKKTVGLGGDTGPKVLSGFIGGVVADEPRAALAARQVLALGGNAADAAVTLGFMLSVTLPSRASLGGGGACLAWSPNGPAKGVPEAIMFVPPAPATRAGDRPAAVPMLARGLYLLSARYGSQPFARLVDPAEQLARTGFPISRALATDIALVAGPLLADPPARAVFGPDAVPLAEGGRLVAPNLANTLEQIATVGVGDMYQGLLAQKLVQASAEAGGPVSDEDLRLAQARLAAPLLQAHGREQVVFLPGPADGGLAASAAFNVLAANPGDMAQAGAAAAQAASTARGAALPPLPASTSFAVIDRTGEAVACALTMNNLFGTGRIAPGTGIVLAASPASKPPALLEAALAYRPNAGTLRAALGASGQNGAALAAAAAMAQALSGGGIAVPDPGRANVIDCPGGVPGGGESCRFMADPRGAGFGAGGG